jgi:2-polyprenyl-6-methoxyphenol hydroxylase-like FAD-dependent oxidoreductase
VDRSNRIIAVGAGLAGLGAARALGARDLDVVVLEARDRLGGRCHGIGGSPAAFEVLAEPIEGRVLFAGGATYRHHWACTRGAYVSGLREAARITGDPNILPPRHFTNIDADAR